MNSTRRSATAAAARPTHTAPWYAMSPIRQSHQPCFVPGPETQSRSSANTAAPSTKNRTLRMESLCGSSGVVEQPGQRIEIGGLGEMVIETGFDRTAAIVG